MHYPLIHESNQRPYHFLHGYTQFLEQQLDLRIPITAFRGDIHLSDAEKQTPPLGTKIELPDHYWIVVAGGKYDFTAKWWNPASFQAVVDHFRGRITFVQCGESGHWHPELSGVVNLVGKTTLREFIRLMYHADGAVCGVTLAMHLAAAVETKPGRPRIRPCVVVAGGREPAHWEAYPNHQFISTNGALPCCAQGGCWKSRCQPVGDGDSKDTRDICEQPVQIRADLRIPQCMDMITSEDVTRRIELYEHGQSLSPSGNGHARKSAMSKSTIARKPHVGDGNGKLNPAAAEKLLIKFRHGLGDAVQLTVVLQHLRALRPELQVDVAALVGKHSAYYGLCHEVFVLDREIPKASLYSRVLEQHTGTHFLRVLLELHPQVSFWKCGRTAVEGRSMGEWHKLHLDGAISFSELLRLGECCEPDLPEWTRQEAAKLGLRVPAKQVKYALVQKHALHTTPWYPSLPTVCLHARSAAGNHLGATSPGTGGGGRDHCRRQVPGRQTQRMFFLLRRSMARPSRASVGADVVPGSRTDSRDLRLPRSLALA